MNAQTNEINICEKLLHIIFNFAGKTAHNHRDQIYSLQDIEKTKTVTSALSLSEIDALIQEGS